MSTLFLTSPPASVTKLSKFQPRWTNEIFWTPAKCFSFIVRIFLNITINNFHTIGEPVSAWDTSLWGEDKPLRDDTPGAILILEFLFISIILHMLFFVLGCNEDKPRDMLFQGQTIENSI